MPADNSFDTVQEMPQADLATTLLQRSVVHEASSMGFVFRMSGSWCSMMSVTAHLARDDPKGLARRRTSKRRERSWRA